MALAALEVEIVNKISNLGAVAEEKAALSGLQTQNPLITGNFGGQLTRDEQKYAEAQLATMGAVKQKAGAVEELTGKMEKSVIVTGEAGSLTEGLARKMSALSALGFTPAGMAILGVVAATAVGVEMGKSWIENADKQEAASKNLAQAFGSIGEKVPTKQLDEFLQKNARFIPNMYDAENALAALARAGFDSSMQFRLLNDALDMSAITGASVSDSATVLIKAHEGQARSLAQFGISLKEVQNPVKALAEAQKEVGHATDEHTKAVRALDEWESKHHDRAKLTEFDLMREQDLKNNVTKATVDQDNANLDLAYAQNLVKDKGDQYLALLDTLEPKIKGARGNISDLQQAQDQLGQSWDRLSNKLGPPLERVLSDVFGGMSDLVDAINNINWKPFLKGWQDDVVTPLTNFFGMLHGWGDDWNRFVTMLGGSTGARTTRTSTPTAKQTGPGQRNARAQQGRGFMLGSQ